MNDVPSILGYVLVSVICAWGVWFLTKELRAMVASRTAIDSTSSKVRKEDFPRLYYQQLGGLVVLIAASACIGIGFGIGLIVELWQLLLGGQ
jgi:hypothetical protein